jgi:hypothetical protein
LSQGNSLVVIGEVGMGKTYLANQIRDRLDCGYGEYRGDMTKCLQGICLSLDCPIVNEDEKPLDNKGLKREIELNLGKKILICDRADKWTANLKGWIETLHEDGHTLLLLGVRRDLEGVLFKVPRLYLEPLKDDQIRTILKRESEAKNLTLSEAKIADLSSRTGGNPLLANRLIMEINQGTESQDYRDSGNYRDISPFLIAIAGLIGALRFVGMATGNIQLRILGGIAIAIFFSLRSLALLFPKEDRRR